MFGRFLVNRVISGVTYIWQQGISVRIEQKSIFKLPLEPKDFSAKNKF